MRTASLTCANLGEIPTYISPLATFAIYALLSSGSGSLNTAQAFTSLSIITLLTNPTSTLLANVPFLAASLGSFDRIQEFLVIPPHQDGRLFLGHSQNSSAEDIAIFSHDESQQDLHGAIALQAIPQQIKTSSWHRMHDMPAILVEHATISPSLERSPAIRDADLSLPAGSLTILLGPIGSGKSTLIKAILGELSPGSGCILTSSKQMSYCAQDPWLPNLSVKNVICGPNETQSVDEDWYRTVLHACALDRDVTQLLERDLTLVGTKGTKLSGGQKQRIVGFACHQR